MDLKLIGEFNESKQYRSKSAFKTITAREVCDMAFMDIIALWILYNEFEFAPLARAYANRTATFNTFNQYRQMGTDLYLNLHIVSENRTDLLGADAADQTLLGRVQVDTRGIIRYLKTLGNNSLNKSQVRITLQRLENSLQISNSNYRSIRRLAQNWPELQTSEKRTVLTRMMFFYQAHGRRNELYSHIKILAKGSNLVDPDAKNPEPSKLKKAAIATAVGAAAGVGGFAAGHHLGRNF